MRIFSLASLSLLSLLSPAAWADVPSPPDLAKTALCTDGKQHYVAITPDDHLSHRLYSGDGKTLRRVAPHPSGMMSGDWFPDPRFYCKTNNDSFRGLDLRVFSHVEYDADKKTCSVSCGARNIPLTVVPTAEAQPLLAAAKLAEPEDQRVPHALARDQDATYYYVDRGSLPDTEKKYRLYVGKKGALKLQKMTDVASDSEGEVFATKTGSLKLILGKGKAESLWVAGKKEKKLLAIPVEANLNMIFTELGVYPGVKLGNPCDDL